MNPFLAQADGSYVAVVPCDTRLYGVRLRWSDHMVFVFNANQWSDGAPAYAFSLSADDRRTLATTTAEHVRIEARNAAPATSSPAQLAFIANHVEHAERTRASTILLMLRESPLDDWKTLPLNRAAFTTA